MKHDDQKWMEAALRYGRRHLGQTISNPSVACVIVHNDIIVGRGLTSPGGRPHAEQNALHFAGANARGASAYVTLEPCAHHGNTPPCADALIQAGVARVVYAVDDPNPLTNKQAKQKFEDAGIEVCSNVCADSAARDHSGHINAVTLSRPFVQLKLAATANDVIGRLDERLLITGEQANNFTYRLRSQVDAVAVGSGTVLADDPTLTCRLPGFENCDNRRIVFDRRLRTPVNSVVVQTALSVATTVMTISGHNTIAFNKAQIDIVVVPELDFLSHALRALADSGIRRVLVEGGASIAQALVEQNLVDEILLIQSATRYDGANAVLLPENCKPNQLAQMFEKFDERKLGDDTILRFWRK